MRDTRHIDHVLHILAELAFLALLAGTLWSSLHGGGLLAGCGAIASACLLAASVISHWYAGHGRYVRDGAPARSAPPARKAQPSEGRDGPARHTGAGVEPPAKGLRPGAAPLADASSDGSRTPSGDQDAHPSPISREREGGPPVAATALVPTEPPPSTLEFPQLADLLVESSDPIAELKRFVGDIRTRQAFAGRKADRPQPCDLERYASRMLEEAGLFATDVELPTLFALRSPHSGMLRLKVGEARVPSLAMRRVIKLEAALNAIRFASASLAPDATQEEAYRLNQGLARSIVAQAPPIDQPPPLDMGGQPDGEWAVRYGISQALETLQLPYRLSARYRTNVADGNVAIEVDLTPADAFPSSCLVEGLGIIPTTGDMRQRAAADYALRLGLLLAASAFRCSERIRHVWVAAVMEGASHRHCYYSVDFDRHRFSRVELDDVGDLQETYRSFAPVLRYEDGWLRPVRQTFHLEEERFCPSRRYMPVSLSSRRLDGHMATSLGTDHVSGLAIEEADGRTVVANAIMRRLASQDDERATQKNVRTVMDLAGEDPDPTVRTAAERVVRGLIEGTLEDDALSVGEEFVRGDALTRAGDHAKELLVQRQPDKVIRALSPVIEAIDAHGTYDDTPTISYRYFGSYVERALYNRIHGERESARSVMLVPNVYYEVHLILSIAHLMTGAAERALTHARRLVGLAPLDARARLHLVRCLETLDRDDEAIEQLCLLLEGAHEPQGLGFAYYRMAFFQWKRGNVAAAQACYQSAMRFLPHAMPMMAMELSLLHLQNPDTLSADVTEEQVEETLAAHGIPVAPTERTSEIFFECVQASLDAEVFPVARNFASILGAFSDDDVIAGLIRSLEGAPDR